MPQKTTAQYVRFPGKVEFNHVDWKRYNLEAIRYPGVTELTRDIWAYEDENHWYGYLYVEKDEPGRYIITWSKGQWKEKETT